MDILTQRELKILELIKNGYENSQISKEIFISTHTVKAHIASILRKLHAKNRTNAVYIALINKIIE